MRKSFLFMMAGAMLASGAALGKLPPPTTEEQAQTAARKAKEQELLEKQKTQLERAQDRVASRYRKSGAVGRRDTGRPADQNMPRTTSELPGGVGPRPDRPQGAESHSAPAK